MLYKKLLNIFIVLLVLSVAALLSYNFWFKNRSANDETGITDIKREIQKISSQRAISPAIAPDEQKIQYFTSDGVLIKSNFDGSQKIEILTLPKENLVKALWSPNKDKIIGLFKLGEGLKKYFYNLKTENLKILSDNIKFTNWHPREDKIVYQWLNQKEEQNNISTAEPDSTNFREILKTRMSDLIVDWQKSQTITLLQKPNPVLKTALFTLNPGDGGLKKILEEYGLTANWQKSQDKFLYSFTEYNGKNLKLFLYDNLSQKKQNLNLITLAEKCVLNASQILVICAAPQNINSDLILPDDWFKNKFESEDEIWQIDLNASEKKLLLIPEQEFDASELILTPDNKNLFFINKKDGLLYRLSMP